MRRADRRPGRDRKAVVKAMGISKISCWTSSWPTKPRSPNTPPMRSRSGSASRSSYSHTNDPTHPDSCHSPLSTSVPDFRSFVPMSLKPSFGGRLGQASIFCGLTMMPCLCLLLTTTKTKTTTKTSLVASHLCLSSPDSRLLHQRLRAPSGLRQGGLQAGDFLHRVGSRLLGA